MNGVESREMCKELLIHVNLKLVFGHLGIPNYLSVEAHFGAPQKRKEQLALDIIFKGGKLPHVPVESI